MLISCFQKLDENILPFQNKWMSSQPSICWEELGSPCSSLLKHIPFEQMCWLSAAHRVVKYIPARNCPTLYQRSKQHCDYKTPTEISLYRIPLLIQHGAYISMDDSGIRTSTPGFSFLVASRTQLSLLCPDLLLLRTRARSCFPFLQPHLNPHQAGPCGTRIFAQRQRKQWCLTYAPGKSSGLQVRGEPPQISEGLRWPSPQTRSQCLLLAHLQEVIISACPGREVAYLSWVGFEKACLEAWVALT